MLKYLKVSASWGIFLIYVDDKTFFLSLSGFLKVVFAQEILANILHNSLCWRWQAMGLITYQGLVQNLLFWKARSKDQIYK